MLIYIYSRSVDPSASTSAEIPATAILGRNASALLSQPSFAPYADDPEQGLGIAEPATMLQTQRHMMDGAFSPFRFTTLV
jgi:hypothetical protein